jgi:hypothetical protein
VKLVPAKSGGASRRSYQHSQNKASTQIAHDATRLNLRTPEVRAEKQPAPVKPAVNPGIDDRKHATSSGAGINMDALRPYFPIRPR